MGKTDNPTDMQPESGKRQLGARELAQRRTAALKTGLHASDENATSLRAKMGKRVRRMVRKERELRPWLDKSDEGLLSMLVELRITKSTLIEELHRKGILGKGAAPSRRLLELEKINTMILRVEAAMPARPDLRGGVCDFESADWRMPIACVKRLLDGCNEPLPAPGEPEAAIQEAQAIIEGGQA